MNAARAVLVLSALLSTFLLDLEPARAQQPDRPAGENDIKFALYSPAWGENSEDAIRLLAHNQTGAAILLQDIAFGEAQDLVLRPELAIAAGDYAEAVLDYVELLGEDDCVERSLGENWKLVEISNYTLHPSVRNLIIEDTDSFRIYQCVQTVRTRWTNLHSGSEHSREEWVLFHFESRVAQ